MKIRAVLLVTTLGLLAGCGGMSGLPGDPSAPSEGDGISADEVAVSVEQGASPSGTPLFDVTFTNNSGVDIRATADFRLIAGNTVLDDGFAATPDRLEVGQSFVGEARFFEIENHGAYECYTYDLAVYTADVENYSTDEETYSTCE